MATVGRCEGGVAIGASRSFGRPPEYKLPGPTLRMFIRINTHNIIWEYGDYNPSTDSSLAHLVALHLRSAAGHHVRFIAGTADIRCRSSLYRIATSSRP